MHDIGAILDGLPVKKIDSVSFIANEFSGFLRVWDSIDEYRLLMCAFVMVCRKYMIDSDMREIDESLLEIVKTASRVIDSGAGEFCYDLMKLLFAKC